MRSFSKSALYQSAKIMSVLIMSFFFETDIIKKDIIKLNTVLRSGSVVCCFVPLALRADQMVVGEGSGVDSFDPLDQEPPAKEELLSSRRQYQGRVDVHVFVAIKEKRKETEK